MCLSAREQLRRSRHSRTFLVESGTGELWSEMQTGKRWKHTDIYLAIKKMAMAAINKYNKQ